MYIDPQIVVLLSCPNCLFTTRENLFLSFPQPPFSSIHDGSLPAEGGKHANRSSEHREVFSFLSLKKSILSVLCLPNTMNIVLWINIRVYFSFSSPIHVTSQLGELRTLLVISITRVQCFLETKLSASFPHTHTMTSCSCQATGISRGINTTDTMVPRLISRFLQFHLNQRIFFFQPSSFLFLLSTCMVM